MEWWEKQERRMEGSSLEILPRIAFFFFVNEAKEHVALLVPPDGSLNAKQLRYPTCY